mgnify:CR=1 FL=1
MAPFKVKQWKPVMDLTSAHPDGPVEVWAGGPKYCHLAMEPGFWEASDMFGGKVPRLYSRVEPSESVSSLEFSPLVIIVNSPGDIEIFGVL